MAFNTAVSFVTNTNWQAYSGEASLGYFNQMLGTYVQNCPAQRSVSACWWPWRAASASAARQLGNLVDLTRGTLVLLPLCLPLALLLVWQGVPTFFDYVHATTLQGAEQTMPLGPAASQIAIKQLGTNGGGFFSVARPIRSRTRRLEQSVRSGLDHLVPGGAGIRWPLRGTAPSRAISAPCCCCSASAWACRCRPGHQPRRRWRSCRSSRARRWRARRVASASPPAYSGRSPPPPPRTAR
ncbi:potassium-transporting ATPase subunit KdpA [Pseudomonas aeruginosa]|uniref:potassium-transporting ATPase subunit KdpA n=1 Tax=Pseudomonas aeruginosa TaxID=287 RepID=UPI003D9C5A86